MKLLTFIERYKFSVLGVLLINLAIFVWSNWFIIETSVPTPNEDRVVAVLDFSKEPIVESEVAPEEISEQNTNTQDLQNVSANADQEKTTYTNNFSKAQAEKEVWEELKAMEAAEFQSLKGENATNTEKNKQNDSQNTNSNLVKDGVEKNDKAGYGMDVQAIVSYYLKDRNVLIEKKPSYLCKSEGIVRVIIKVNQKGQVVSKEIDESKTNTQNVCLRNAALEYVELWKFNQNFNDELRKQGWIEFKYQAQ